jgi:hypothetical protein
MALGAIVKSVGGKLAKQQVKKVAKDKLMGRKKKPTASKKTAENMVSGGVSTAIEKRKSSKTLAKTDGRRGYKGPSLEIVQAEIDAKETDKRMVKISKDVTAIAEAMKGGLVLKDKAAQKERKAAEKEKRAAQEAETEKPDEPKKKDSGDGGGFKVPGVGLLGGIFGFITKFIYGMVIMKLIELAPKLKGLLGLLKGAGKVFNFLIDGAGFILDALIGFVDFGYKLVDGAEKIVGKIFGEEGAEKFRTFIKNFTTLINSFLIFKILKDKVLGAIIRNIKNAFKFAKNIIKTAGKIAAKLFPNLAKGAGKIFQAGKGLVSKGVAKVGGFAAKIFGKAAGTISPAFKGAKPFLSKFFGKVPIVGPLVITIVSLLSGEPASQAIFKGLGAALGGALGTFIPIPILGTLIGETIGVFVGDLLYELLMGGGIDAVGQKLKDTFMTIFKGGKAVADWVGGGIKAFVNNVLKTDAINVKEGFGVRSVLTKGLKIFGLYNFFEGLGFAGGKNGQIDKFPNLLNIINPLKFYPLLFKSFFGKRDESEVSAGGGGTAVVSDEDDTITTTISGSIGSQETFGGKGGSTYENASDNVNTIEGRISRSQQNKAGKDAEAVASETTYESGEGNAVIIPLPSGGGGSPMVTGRKRGRGSGVKVKTVVVDDTELALYGGK